MEGDLVLAASASADAVDLMERESFRFERTAANDLELETALKELKKRRVMRHRVRSLGALSDISAILIGFAAANLIWYRDPLHEQGVLIAAVLLPLFVISALNYRVYGTNSVLRARTGAVRAALALLTALAAVELVTFFLKVSTDFSRAVFALGAVFSVMAIPAGRAMLSRWARRRIGASSSELVLRDGSDLKVSDGALVLDTEYHRLGPRLDDPAMLDRLGRAVEHADRVIVACPAERRSLWAMALRGANVESEIVTPDLDMMGAIALSRFEDNATLVVAAAPLGILDRVLKRTLDIALAVAALPIALPLMGAVALAIKLDSRGPILFSQERVGLGNRIFKMFKFRSMYTDRTDHLGSRSASRDDDRVTRVGRIIRATSLDELPQLFNVLSGAMSVVGPRPHPLLCKAEDRLFWDIDLRYWHRHAVKPGLTGLAQVRGFRGATEKESHFTDRLQADLEYLSGWTIWRDLHIILATFRVLIHRNAF